MPQIPQDFGPMPNASYPGVPEAPRFDLNVAGQTAEALARGMLIL